MCGRSHKGRYVQRSPKSDAGARWVPLVKRAEEALDAHREALHLAERRVAARRAGALADFVVEHGEHGLRAVGGRRAAQALLDAEDPGADVPALIAALEAKL